VKATVRILLVASLLLLISCSASTECESVSGEQLKEIVLETSVHSSSTWTLEASSDQEHRFRHARTGVDVCYRVSMTDIGLSDSALRQGLGATMRQGDFILLKDAGPEPF
jgi:hypothetical protein